MKIFGGGPGRKETKRENAPQRNQETMPKLKMDGKAKRERRALAKAEKKKRVLTKAEKKKRIIIIGSALAACLVFVAAGVVYLSSVVKAPTNDPTIKDPENGDAVDLLNSGDRISDVFTFVICATDEDGTRTDAIMVATMDVKEKSINVMNIPRDTMSNITSRSGAARKINAAYGLKHSTEQVKKEVELLMGFVPDKYIVANFDGIAEIVDAIDGVDYEIPFRMLYDDPTQNLHIDLPAGRRHLNGKEVVDFLRWRKNNYGVSPAGYVNGDEGRVENQQKFLKALAAEVLQVKNVTKIKTLSDVVFKNVTTDFTAGEMLWMSMQAVQIDNDKLQMFMLPGYGAMSTANSSDAYSFFFPYYNETLELVNKHFNPFTTDITTLSMVSGPTSAVSTGRGSSKSDSGDDDYTWSNSQNNDSSGSSVETDDPEDTTKTDDTKNSNDTAENTGETNTQGGDSTGGNNTDTDTDPENTENNNNQGGTETPGGDTDTAPAPEPAPEPTPDKSASGGAVVDPEG